MIACLCGSDASYECEGVAVAQVLRAAGARHLFLAGKPNILPGDLAAAGVETFINTECDALTILQQAARQA
jgi:methylmalonyl-CoA mutase